MLTITNQKTIVNKKYTARAQNRIDNNNRTITKDLTKERVVTILTSTVHELLSQ
jgi:hypothetical protein